MTGPTGAGVGGVQVFHTLIESFARVEYDPASDSWTVVRTDGRRLYFGQNADSRVSAGTITARWLLSEVRNPFFQTALGNAITYEYVQDAGIGGEGTRYPTRIAYADATREVLFKYESRPDPISDFRGGLERRVSDRLREIQVVSHGALLHRVVLSYDATGYGTDRSRLTSVQRFGTDCPDLAVAPTVLCAGKGLPPVVLSYSESVSTHVVWDEAARYNLPFPLIDNVWNAYMQQTSNLFADINGDGLPDLIHEYNKLAANPEYPSTSMPYIFLNTGLVGFEGPEWIDESGNTIDYLSDQIGTPKNASAEWTDRLRALTYLTPQLTATQTEPVDGIQVDHFPNWTIPHIGICDSTGGVEWVTDSVKTGPRTGA